MTLFQIIMVSIIGVAFVAALGFAIAFIIEAVRGAKVTSSKKSEEIKKEELDIDRMLAQLEKVEDESKKEETEEPAEEAVAEEQSAEVEEILLEEPVLEVVEEDVAPVATEEVVEEPAEEEVIEEVKEEKVEETTTSDDDEDDTEDDETDDEDAQPVKEAPKTILIKEVTTETVGTDFDYNVRLAKIVESKNKMEKDLQKTKRAIVKYERTERRRARNQKMLDRRAVELTNLNLMMYSVTDIKNVDADKKAKQEELTTHIAELKASIQDADIFLAKNKERYEHDKKMYAFYVKEEARYNDEIKELEILIKNANSITGSTTTTTTETI